MREEDLRAIVREAVERHLRPTAATVPLPAPPLVHASHRLLSVGAGETVEDGPCFIERTVRCDRCGYCLSYGH